MRAIKPVKLRFDNPKLFALTLIMVVLVGSYFSYALTNNVVIPNSATISLSSITAKSGSPADIQAAVNTMAAAGGGTVYVPAGTYYWNGETVTSPGGVSIIGSSNAGCKGHTDNWQNYNATTILHNNLVPTAGGGAPFMLSIDGSNGKSFRISGIRFEFTGPPNAAAEWNAGGNDGISVTKGKNFRIDHCTFINASGTAIFSTLVYDPAASAYGVVDHCFFDLPYKLNSDPTGWCGGYGVDSLGAMLTDYSNYVDDVSRFAGKYEAITACALTITEDCSFKKYRHAIDSYCGGASIVRYCHFEPYSYLNNANSIGDLDMHGGGWGNTYAGELLEAYGNTITGLTSFGTSALRIRGGHGLFYNNTFDPPDAGNKYQVFVTLDSDGLRDLSQTYIWSNSYSNCTFLDNNGGYTEDVDYFLRAPTLALDGFTYTPHTYPIATG